MIIAGCFLFCMLYLLVTLRQDLYRAWRWLIPAVAACYLALWSMPEVSAMLTHLLGEGDLKLLRPFCRSAAVLLTGAIVLTVLRIAVGKLSPLADPEFPVWLDRPASLAARLVTALMFVLLLLQSALVLPAAATFSGFRGTAEKADSAVLFGSAFLNRLSGQSSRTAEQRGALTKLREFSLREAECIAESEKAEREKAEGEKAETEEKPAEAKAASPAGETGSGAPPPEASGGSASLPGTLLSRTKSRLQTIYDNHNRNLESGGASAPGAEASRP